uniref:WD repeat-containing protein 7 n=1 Tax=Ciona intestinalis TaxID=7719 RepID=UPI0002B8E5C7|nr:WD repeat-containing protein 7 [Ciona intestinalis]|eukprot:XP_002123988.2 WD repeat-containing protein 7 [Ciona intestinalis]
MSNSLIVPIVLWGSTPPTHRVSAVTFTPDFQNIVTGCRDGQLCVWDVIDGNIAPKLMIFGHSSSVVSVTTVKNDFLMKEESKTHFVSASQKGEVCLWDITDGRCLEQNKLLGTPTCILGQNFVINNEPKRCVLCYGQFAEILILSASTLSTLLSLNSRIYPDWIACACVAPVQAVGEECNVIGLTVSGMIKVWRLPSSSSANVLYEEESRQVNYTNSISVKISQGDSKVMLIICTHAWQVCDYGDCSLLCYTASVPGQPWSGGDFVSDNSVAVWSKNGVVHIYQLPFSIGQQESYRSSLKQKQNLIPKSIRTFNIFSSEQHTLPPIIKLYCNKDTNKLHFVTGGYDASVAVNQVSITLESEVSNTYSNFKKLWESLDSKPPGIIDQLSHDPKEPCNVTASLFIAQYCYLCCGREDGSIVIVPAAKTCKSNLLQDEFSSRKGWPPHRTLRGHRDRVTCLLYPYQEASNRYSPEVLVSGSADFSVVVWDIMAGTLLHSFHTHGGEVYQLLVPPDTCNQRIKQSICSVGIDHSVALLNLRDRKCILLASRHPSPIVAIRWRPEEDFLIIACSDCSVFVWQMETGHLDRFEQGEVAANILAACDEQEIGDTTKPQHSVNISQALKHRNINAFKALAQQGLKSIMDGLDDQDKSDADTEARLHLSNSTHKAMLVSSLRASSANDTDSHIVFFNTEALIAKLLLEHSAKAVKKSRITERSRNPASAGKNMINNLIKQVKNQLLDDGSDLSSSEANEVQAPSRKGKKSPSLLQLDSAIDIAQIIVSCLHAWGMDPGIDDLCIERLGLLLPKTSICFGLLSHGGHMALMMPRKITGTLQENENGKYHWGISSSLTTQHLTAVISLANTMMELPNASFKSKMKRAAHETTDSTSDDVSRHRLDSVEQSQVKQSWSLLATLHCVLLPEHMEGEFYKPPKLEFLARRWQDRCLELREAAQALMLAELRQMGASGRRKVVEVWSHHIPDYVEQQPHPVEMDHPTSPASSNMIPDEVGDRSSLHSEDLISAPSHHTRHNTTKLSYEVRRRHATAIVILGVIGAEFGQEIEPRRKVRSNSDIPEGFGLCDYSLARHTCKALVYLLLQPPSSKLPAHIPIRRAAIDLLGRGFTVWEPYMEVSAVLLGLLELCETYTRHIASIQSGLPLNPDADSCRSAHHSLSLIATARPLTFITTIAREVARHNAAAANPQHQALLASSVLVRAKPEVLRIIELLADKMISDVNNVLVEVVDIVLFCIDISGLRNSFGLLEAVPALAKFHTISYDPRSKRIAVAAGNGAIVLYDIRTCKHQIVPRSGGRITALCFSPEGKYLCVYSADENQLSFWITATSLFGMLQSQVKCIKTLSPLKMHNSSAQTNGGMSHSRLNLSKLVWVSNRVVVLLTSEGSEHRFHI